VGDVRQAQLPQQRPHVRQPPIEQHRVEQDNCTEQFRAAQGGGQSRNRAQRVPDADHVRFSLFVKPLHHVVHKWIPIAQAVGLGAGPERAKLNGADALARRERVKQWGIRLRWITVGVRKKEWGAGAAEIKKRNH
jgi:hypothetical protein